MRSYYQDSLLPIFMSDPTPSSAFPNSNSEQAAEQIGSATNPVASLQSDRSGRTRQLLGMKGASPGDRKSVV